MFNLVNYNTTNEELHNCCIGRTDVNHAILSSMTYAKMCHTDVGCKITSIDVTLFVQCRFNYNLR